MGHQTHFLDTFNANLDSFWQTGIVDSFINQVFDLTHNWLQVMNKYMINYNLKNTYFWGRGWYQFLSRACFAPNDIIFGILRLGKGSGSTSILFYENILTGFGVIRKILNKSMTRWKSKFLTKARLHTRYIYSYNAKSFSISIDII